MKKIDLKELFDTGLVYNPMPAVGFVQQDFDKRQWWLNAFFVKENVYRTSVNMTKWNKMSLKTKADLLNLIKDKLFGL
jgi:hypothetical protein